MSNEPPSKSDLPTRVIASDKRVARKPTQPPQHACLIQYNGDALGRRHVLAASQIVIGRGASAHIVILDDSVSREHAKCNVSGHTVEIEDLDSSNGTFINGHRIAGPTVLRDGDMLQLGSVHFKYFADDSVENVFHDEIYRKATIDVGTQVFNKQYLLEALDEAFNHSRLHGRPVSVVYFDLDHFKKVNDTYGHSCGDYILRECAQLAKSCLRSDDTLGRYGGEEFVVVLPNSPSRLAAALADRLRKNIEAHAFTYQGNALKQTVSMGVSEIQPAFKTARDLLDDADRKLYQSKQSGRNRVTV